MRKLKQVLLACVLGIVVFALSGCGAKTIDLNKYVTIVAEGYDSTTALCCMRMVLLLLSWTIIKLHPAAAICLQGTGLIPGSADTLLSMTFMRAASSRRLNPTPTRTI